MVTPSNPVLLVEDNPDDEWLTLRSLKRSKIANQVDVARTGEEALDYVFGRGPFCDKALPSVVLLDLKLPGIDGLEVLSEIRKSERAKYLPVVLLTSSDHDRDRLEGYARGVNSFVRKPVDAEKFFQAIQQLGMYWLVLNEPPPDTA